MEKAELLPKNLLIFDLKRRFTTLNPDLATDLIDWESYVPRHVTFGEALESMREAFPVYEWGN